MRTGVAAYADAADAVLIAPSCGNNYFADGQNGLKYETYLFRELIPFLQKTLFFKTPPVKKISFSARLWEPSPRCGWG